MRALLLALLLATGACTTIGHQPPPEDWPKLEARVHKVTPAERREACSVVRTAWYVTVEACAIIKFAARTCDIYLDSEMFEEHEHEHCKGKDHMGSRYLAEAWKAYKRIVLGQVGVVE